MKPFTKPEKISLVIIFAVLVAVSVPNFIVSLRRARDQVRRDDMGVLVHALDEYAADNRSLPLASPDGRIMDCLKPGDKPVKDKRGFWIVNPHRFDNRQSLYAHPSPRPRLPERFQLSVF